jgi:hypothetical protein
MSSPWKDWKDPSIDTSSGKLDLPDILHDSLVAYIETGRPTGGFLEAVLSNDLMGAFKRADAQSCAYLEAVARWLYDKAPGDAWGDYKTVQKWIRKQGLEGQGRTR